MYTLKITFSWRIATVGFPKQWSDHTLLRIEILLWLLQWSYNVQNRLKSGHRFKHLLRNTIMSHPYVVSLVVLISVTFLDLILRPFSFLQIRMFIFRSHPTIDVNGKKGEKSERFRSQRYARFGTNFEIEWKRRESLINENDPQTAINYVGFISSGRCGLYYFVIIWSLPIELICSLRNKI